MVQIQEGLTALQKERLQWKPEVPFELSNLQRVSSRVGKHQPCSDKILKAFPNLSILPLIQFTACNPRKSLPKRVGVLFSGGQAAGGHNVIAGLLDGLLELNRESEVVGFLNGPKGLLERKTKEITKELIDQYRNQGGFDLLGSGRDKIDSIEQFEKVKNIILQEKLNGLVIIGGDDSNTIAAYLAEYFAASNVDCAVVGIPKTIDGDLKNEYIEISFGFDTACKTYAELIGNISRDILSAKKYYAFIRLMGRSASHITLQCALATHPNLTLISEDILHKKKKLSDIVDEICHLIMERAAIGKRYGVILLPEGIIESIPDFHDEPLIQDLDPHGNIQVSKIESERFLIELVQKELAKRDASFQFSPIPFFLGYEGRAALPSNFDANYCYALGLSSALAVEDRANGYICTLQGLSNPPQEWNVSLVPLAWMMGFEMRKGKETAVVKKTLVELDQPLFKSFESMSPSWRLEDHYRYVGPIQFFGPKELTDFNIYR